MQSKHNIFYDKIQLEVKKLEYRDLYDKNRILTGDIDLNFIKYSLDDFSIKNFIEIINTTDNDTNIEINGTIVTFHHQNYDRIIRELNERKFEYFKY